MDVLVSGSRTPLFGMYVAGPSNKDDFLKNKNQNGRGKTFCRLFRIDLYSRRGFFRLILEMTKLVSPTVKISFSFSSPHTYIIYDPFLWKIHFKYLKRGQTTLKLIFINFLLYFLAWNYCHQRTCLSRWQSASTEFRCVDTVTVVVKNEQHVGLNNTVYFL